LAGASIDHLVSLIIFISAITLFIGLFSQTIQTGINYQLHRAVSSKCSDLLDNMLLSSGIPPEWGGTSNPPEGFGLQAVEFTQYQLSPFSLMRLQSSTGTPVHYNMTGQTYSNVTMGFGQSLLVPYSETVNYSTASKLLGINASYGFSLTLAPIVKVTISQTQAAPSLGLSIAVSGPGFPLANANVDYCLITVQTQGEGSYPTYSISYGSSVTDNSGVASVSFAGFNGNAEAYAFVACAHVSGLVGLGYYEHVLYDKSYVIPFISSFADRTAILAHSWDVVGGDDPDAAIQYNATFVVLSEDFKLREMPFANETGSAVGLLNSGQDPQHAYDTLTIGTNNPGILIVTYSKSATDRGIVVMPWGIGSLAFPITFGGTSNNTSWVAIDIRQVMVNGIAYQAKLSVWSLSGYEVNG
jgi:hypothetical protein